MRKAVVACACVGLSLSAVRAADFYWTGAANDQMATNRLNWADADGQPVAAAPTHEDTVIFNLTEGAISCYKYSNRTDYEYRKLILHGNKTLTFYGYGDCPTDNSKYIDSKGAVQGYAFYLPLEVVNESDGGDIKFGGRDPRVARGTSTHYATNIVHVANANATVNNTGHIQQGDNYHKVIKTGPGKLIPFGGNNYGIKNLTLQEGTVAFSTHAQRNWRDCQLVFLGDAPNKVFDFTYKNVSGTYDIDGQTLGPEYWSKYVFQAPLAEEGVTTTSHELRSSNGADLVYTNAVTDMSFTGRIRGSLNVHWAPDDVTQVFTYSKGESDTTGRLNVIRGRMEMRDGARFTALSKLTVGEAAVLDLAAGTAIVAQEAVIGGTALAPGLYVNAGGEGRGQLTGSGVLLVGGAPLTVPYVDATKTTTPFDVTASDVTAASLAGLKSLPVALSEPMAIDNSSMHVTNRLAVAKFAATSGITAALFEDVTTKSYGLPTTWFESETVADVTTIYLVAKPVISAVLYQGTAEKLTYYYTGDANFWSDGKLPHAGADYCNTFNQTEKTGKSLYFRDANVSGSTKVTTVFGGDSLTVGHSLLYLSSHVFACDLRTYNRDEGNYSLLSAQNTSQSPQHLAGRLYADSSNNPLALKPYASTVKPFGKHGDVFVVDSDIYGPGNVKCVYTWSTSTLAEMALHGNNSGLTGQMEFKGGVQNDAANKKQYWQQFEMAITNANALGGPMATESKTGFKMSFFPLLMVNATTTYETENRLWYAENGVRLQVTDGCAFALKKDYRCRTTQTETLNLFIPQRCAVEKTGAGDFLLGGRIIPVDASLDETAVDGTNNLVRVYEGGIGPLTADAFDLCQLVFSNGTSIVAEKGNAATADCGLRLRDLAPVFVDGAKVTLRPVVSGGVDGLSFTQTFLTVPAATPDLRQTLVPGKVRIDGKVWSGKLLKDTVTIAGRDYTRYSALYEPKGSLILVR